MAVKTASPVQLVVMLYDAAIHAIREAQEQIDRGEISGRARSINKSIQIISELQSSLNRAAGGQIAGSLDRLYDYMKATLFQAGVDQSKALLAETITLLESLRSAWGQIADQPAAALPQMPKREALEASPAVPAQMKSLNISI